MSPLVDFTEGKFQEVIEDPYADAKKVKRVLFCSGKIYYDLLDKQQSDQRKDVAIVRIEQLYPTPVQQMAKIKSKYSKATEFIWVQEEPEKHGCLAIYVPEVPQGRRAQAGCDLTFGRKQYGYRLCQAACRAAVAHHFKGI